MVSVVVEDIRASLTAENPTLRIQGKLLDRLYLYRACQNQCISIMELKRGIYVRDVAISFNTVFYIILSTFREFSVVECEKISSIKLSQIINRVERHFMRKIDD